MNEKRSVRHQPGMNTTIIGSIVVLVALLGLLLSYNANRGLPFVPTFDVVVEVPDGARLVEGSEVRIGGARVGRVRRIEASRSPRRETPFARVHLSLDRNQTNLPIDTRVAIRPRSLLGAKFVDLIPGTSDRAVRAGGRLPLHQAVPVVEISDTFEIFGPKPAKGLQDTIVALGDGFAGRGSTLNAALGDLNRALPYMQRVLRAMVEPGSDLDGFVEGLAATGRALAPVSVQLGRLVSGTATTFGALDEAGPALGDSIGEFAAIGRVGGRALSRTAPVLRDAAALVRDLRPAGRELALTSRVVATGLEQATPVLRRVRELRGPLQRTLTTLERVAVDPAAGKALRRLTATVIAVGSALGVIAPAQRHCNVLGVWARNGGAIADQGDENGNWLTFLLMAGDEENNVQNGQPSSRIHLNPLPRTDATECESGNERFGDGRRLGSPPGIQRGTDDTAPPPGVRELAARAGLLHEGPQR